jgi:ABC-type branched-subunit amino acid transport system ATPase component
VLLIEQQLRFATRYADRIYLMSKGRVVHHCKPAELAADVRARYLGV